MFVTTPSAPPVPVDQVEAAYAHARAMDAPLADKLRYVADAVRAMDAGFADQVDRFVARLAAVSAGQSAPGCGEKLPGFMLPDSTGRLVSLDALLCDGPVAVVFVRGHWCPYCRLNVADLVSTAATAHPIQLVVIAGETQAYTAAMADEVGATFPILSDLGHGYALSLNLAIWVDDAMACLIEQAGWDVPAYQGQPGWLMPIPSVFVLDRDGMIIERHVDADYRQRFALEPKLPELKARLGLV
ncbi:MAG: AhpC/TSA family protein [Sphingomonas sp.]|nr:peroxiredoxin [Zymomonas sp.]MBA4773659.1 AhpC/TSA family protein [Sphingomonas sp.]PZP20144.1 MAG: peroxiredoxin [Sphingomonas hengshuiensis]